MSALPNFGSGAVLHLPPKSLPKYSDFEGSKVFMLEHLAKSGLVPDDILAYPVSPTFRGEAGYCIPYTVDGVFTGMYRIRYDRKEDKCIGPKGIFDIWTPPQQSSIVTATTIYLIEGEKQSAAYKKHYQDRVVYGMGGCAGYATSDGFLVPSLLNILKPGMKVVAIFDSDIETNVKVSQAARRLDELLQYQRCELSVCYPPTGKGVDDWLLADPLGSLALCNVELSTLSSFSRKLGQALGCVYRDDKLVLNELNAKLILAALWHGSLVHDRRRGLLLNGQPFRLDDLDNKALEFMQRYVSAQYRPNAVSRGLAMSVTQHVDILQDFTRGLKWDGTPRLATWGSSHFDTNFPALANEWGRLLMTGMTLRLLEPGTKVDLVCILGGPQGVLKSTFFETLAEFEGHRYYTTCTHMNTTQGDAKRTQGGQWVRSVLVDLAEGVIFAQRHKANIDLIKQEIAERHDEFRYVFERESSDILRGFIFVGTTNRTDLFGDFTGSRRFLVLSVLSNITPLPYEEKLQIMAEVVAQENKIRNSNWWDLQLSMDDLPLALKEAHPTITSVQELLNTEFSKSDEFAVMLQSIIEGKLLPTIVGEGGAMFVTTHYLAQREGLAGSHSKKTVYATFLNGLTQSPTFPYVLRKHRVTTGRLQRPSQAVNWHLGEIAEVPSAIQQQGWWITPKPSRENPSS